MRNQREKVKNVSDDISIHRIMDHATVEYSYSLVLKPVKPKHVSSLFIKTRINKIFISCLSPKNLIKIGLSCLLSNIHTAYTMYINLAV